MGERMVAPEERNSKFGICISSAEETIVERGRNMRKLIPLAIIGAILIATPPPVFAKNPFAPGQLKKRFGPVPGYPGASGYAPGHLKHRYGAWGYVRPSRGYTTYRW